jgi:hypothetical protein
VGEQPLRGCTRPDRLRPPILLPAENLTTRNDLLFSCIEKYRLDEMRPSLHTFKACMATFVSLWIGVLACFMGCALPALADQRQSGPMTNVEHCCHSSSKSPVRPSDGKSSPIHGMSCCPLEVTVAAKWDAATMRVALPQHFILASNLDLATTWFYYSVEIVSRVWHSGRDTLLETQLLRI